MRSKLTFSTTRPRRSRPGAGTASGPRPSRARPNGCARIRRTVTAWADPFPGAVNRCRRRARRHLPKSAGRIHVRRLEGEPAALSGKSPMTYRAYSAVVTTNALVRSPSNRPFIFDPYGSGHRRGCARWCSKNSCCDVLNGVRHFACVAYRKSPRDSSVASSYAPRRLIHRVCPNRCRTESRSSTSSRTSPRVRAGTPCCRRWAWTPIATRSSSRRRPAVSSALCRSGGRQDSAVAGLCP